MVDVRPAGPGDEEFLRDLSAAVLAEQWAPAGLPDAVARPLAEQQVRARDGQYRASFPVSTDHVLLSGGRRVGRCWTAVTGDALHVLDVAVATADRRRGVATAALCVVLAEAQVLGVPVTLSVWADDPAAGRLYAGLGFRPVPGSAGADGRLQLRHDGPVPACTR
ncbi:hypothetical protein ASG41_22330 [Modestobacter sp. Leaf380]|nr:hypothetical protein ASG41_22330 [Modestobacter sp. Leaf380]